MYHIVYIQQDILNYVEKNFNLDKFFTAYRMKYNSIRSGTKREAEMRWLLERLFNLEIFSNHPLTLPFIAYIIATVKYETKGTYLPRREYIKDPKEGLPAVFARKDIITRQQYYKRGYIPFRWKYNYAQFSKWLKIDLLNNPDQALDKDIAFKILVLGMYYGLFTSNCLADYITEKVIDFKSARRVIHYKPIQQVEDDAKFILSCLKKGYS